MPAQDSILSNSCQNLHEGDKTSSFPRKAFCLGGAVLMLLLLAYSLCIWHEVGTHQEKLWLHCCNSLEKRNAFRELYPNAEVDVTLREDGTWDVTHDAEISFGLSVEAFLADLHAHPGKLWLDVKNLQPQTAVSALHRLDSLCRFYGVDRQRLVVESDCSEALGSFTRERYFTSYYVRDADPADLEEVELQAVLKKLRGIVDSGNVCALSFPVYWYATLSAHLHRDIPFLTWDHHTLQWTFLWLPQNRKLLNDGQVKVILLKKKGKYHR